MENRKKSKLLLCAGILGFCGLVLWAVVLFAPLEVSEKFMGEKVLPAFKTGAVHDDTINWDKEKTSVVLNRLYRISAYNNLVRNGGGIPWLSVDLTAEMIDYKGDVRQNPELMAILEKDKRGAVGWLTYLFISFASLIISLALNCLGWRKENKMYALIAAILYFVSLTLPSSILCFAAFGKFRK